MTRRVSAVLDALLPAAFVAIIAGACLSVADYFALMSAERVFERWSWLPQGWSHAHGSMVAAGAILIAVPVMGFIAWWMYRTARRAQDGSGEPC